MQEYTIEVSQIEELQMIRNIAALDRIFTRARQTIVNGENVILGRKSKDGIAIFDKLTTLEDLEIYRKEIYKYL
ncbi:MAG TPA: hypothetical protein VHK91_14025 [Flavisolibacter sp.]|jgi:hypothetical protein|nr:hypothetical protein [Flavisolibacter sp.]